jgi:hypothetical protein
MNAFGARTEVERDDAPSPVILDRFLSTVLLGGAKIFLLLPAFFPPPPLVGQFVSVPRDVHNRSG